jgi:hypothetical protein
MTRLRLAAMIIAFGALGAACSSSGSATPPSSAGKALAAHDTPTTAAPATTIAGAPADTSKKATTNTTTSRPAGGAPSATGGAGQTTTSTTAAVTRNGNFPFALTITPRCVTRADELVVDLRTRGYASIAAALAFSDDQPHGAYTVTTAEPDGHWKWVVKMPPEAPYGPGKVLISAQDRSADSNEHGGRTNGESASTSEPFELRSKCT